MISINMIESTSDRFALRSATGRCVIIAVTPDEDEDDCLAEARDHVETFYGDDEDVSSITCEGWEGGHEGPRERVIVEVRLAAAPRWEDLVVVEVMPRSTRASHEAAGNRGRYPANGAERYLVEALVAAELAEGDPDWTEILRDATAADLGKYDIDRDGEAVAQA